MLTDGKEARFLFLPDGEDPDDFVRGHGKAAFERAIDGATPLSEYLLAELAAQHPPNNAEGRAALVAAARPYANQIAAPVLRALVRRQLAELAGLPEAQLGALLGPDARRRSGRAGKHAAHPDPAVRHGGRPRCCERCCRASCSSRRSPAATICRRPTVMAPRRPPGARWSSTAGPRRVMPTTASVIQHFAGSDHEGVLAELLASAADQELSAEQAETQVLAAAERWRRADAQRALQALLRQPLDQLSAEERESLTRGLAATARGLRRDD